jgi:hypothetical protein
LKKISKRDRSHRRQDEQLQSKVKIFLDYPEEIDEFEKLNEDALQMPFQLKNGKIHVDKKKEVSPLATETSPQNISKAPVNGKITVLRFTPFTLPAKPSLLLPPSNLLTSPEKCSEEREKISRSRSREQERPDGPKTPPMHLRPPSPESIRYSREFSPCR